MFKKKYLKEIKINPGTEVSSLPANNHGWKMMLGEDLNAKVKNYVQALRSASTPIGSNVVMAAGEGIVRAHDRTLLVQYRDRIQILKSWAMSLLKRMSFVKCKTTTKSTPGMSGEDSRE